jgi:site-specific DNA-methyltransferase (adenine-specific)
MIYEKNGCAHSARKWDKRYTQIFEYMFVFSKGTPKTASLICDRENRWAGVNGFGTPTTRKKDGSLVPYIQKPTPKLSPRTNIWRLLVSRHASSNPKAFEHPAIFPETLVLDHLRTWTEEGDVVLDPFNGSGTTSVVTKNMNRQFIGLDISKKYCKLAIGRVEDILDLEKLQAASQRSNNQKEELKS